MLCLLYVDLIKKNSRCVIFSYYTVQKKKTLLFYICYHKFIVRHNDLNILQHKVYTAMQHVSSSQFISVALVAKFNELKTMYGISVTLAIDTLT